MNIDIIVILEIIQAKFISVIEFFNSLSFGLRFGLALRLTLTLSTFNILSKV